MNWISIEHELPPRMTEIMIFGLVDGIKNDILLGYLDNDDQWHTTYMVYADALLNTVTWQPSHWMPLPDYPPEESKWKCGLTTEQVDHICYQIGNWYLMMKPLLEVQHNLGYMKEKLKTMICGEGEVL